MIPQRDLSRIANGLLRPRGRRVPEAVIERDYCLAWFLTGLAQHPLREFLAFKGGTALRAAGSRTTASPRISTSP
jgi:predicted nucleotidyltransferase component of viral defense system